jgi:hypothetical protein
MERNFWLLHQKDFITQQVTAEAGTKGAKKTLNKTRASPQFYLIIIKLLTH